MKFTIQKWVNSLNVGIFDLSNSCDKKFFIRIVIFTSEFWFSVSSWAYFQLELSNRLYLAIPSIQNRNMRTVAFDISYYAQKVAYDNLKLRAE